jgi:hypothetical protein
METAKQQNGKPALQNKIETISDRYREVYE